MSSLMDELRDAWSKAGAGPNPGASLDDVRRFEETFNVVLPDDAREYFCAVNGAKHLDSQLIDFKPLAELESIRKIYPADEPIPGSSEWFIFADYLCQTHLYIIEMQPTRQPTSRIIFLNGEQGVMAPSLHEFFVGTCRILKTSSFPQSSNHSYLALRMQTNPQWGHRVPDGLVKPTPEQLRPCGQPKQDRRLPPSVSEADPESAEADFALRQDRL